MATTYASEVSGVLDGTEPADKADGALQGGRLIRYRATITLASQGIGDVVVLAKPRIGQVFAGGRITSSVSLGTATVSIGPASSVAAYRADAVHTAVDVPTAFGKASAISSAAISSEENIILTVGTAALPAAGTLVVDLLYSKS